MELLPYYMPAWFANACVAMIRGRVVFSRQLNTVPLA
jgi:hypothetical protein